MQTEPTQSVAQNNVPPPIDKTDIGNIKAGKEPASSFNDQLQSEKETGRIEGAGNFNFNKYLKNEIGDPPADMADPHAHHILFKEGNGQAQKVLVKEGQALLARYGIDPIFGLENLVWAPNRVEGQHGIEALENVVEQLKEMDRLGGDYDDIVQTLNMLGKLAAKRRKR